MEARSEHPQPGEIRVISRATPLATTQVEEAMAVLRPLFGEKTRFTCVTLSTPGDRDQATPLTDASVSDDFFTRDLDEALLKNEADIVIHSSKDLPKQLRSEFVVVRLPARDIRDALVFRREGEPGTPPRVVGTSSPRREAYLRALYPDAEIRPIRGSIGERLRQLDDGDYDCVIIAACALERLGLAERIGRYVDADPEPDQGRLAITARKVDRELVSLLQEADVTRKAGPVALVECPAQPSLLSIQARQYLEHADVVVHDAACPAELLDALGVRAARRSCESGTPRSEIHRMLLTEAEQGKLVVRLHAESVDGSADDLAFLAEWNIRALALSASVSRSSSPLTLFVGTDTTPFLRHGPFLHWPVIQLSSKPLEERVAIIEEAIDKVDGVLFPSRFAVCSFMAAMTVHADTRALSGKHLLAVGPATADALLKAGLRADRAAGSFGGLRDLAASITADLAGSYLYPCSDAAPQEQRKHFLADYGVELLPRIFYTNRTTPFRELPSGPFTRVLFTSTSSVRAYFERYPAEREADRVWVAVGPPTQEALQALGLTGQLLGT